jgi:hypothetical protein
LLEYRSVSSDIETQNLASFPGIGRLTIGSRKNTRFFELDDTPGPAMPHQATVQSPAIRIRTRVDPPEHDRLPGPGTYDPDYPRPRPKSVLAIGKGASRSDIWSSIVVSPPPGAYDPTPPLPKVKRWATRLRTTKPLPVIPLRRGGRQDDAQQAPDEKLNRSRSP